MSSTFHTSRLLALGFALAMGSAAAVATPQAREKSITLTGCLLKGEGDGAGYLLTNGPAEPFLNGTDPNVQPGAVGTSGDYGTVFYWLDGNGDLKHHIGHRVEVEGDLKGDVKDGEIKLDRKDRWTELTVKSDGRTMKANVPNMSIVPAPGDKDPKKGKVLVRRVDVEHVKMIGANCQ